MASAAGRRGEERKRGSVAAVSDAKNQGVQKAAKTQTWISDIKLS
jgi:hypothetical protein